MGCHISDVCINHVFYADDLSMKYLHFKEQLCSLIVIKLGK